MGKIDAYIASWLSHRESLIELLEVVDDDHLNFKPWEGAMTLSELVQHISNSTSMFVQTVKNGEFTSPAKDNRINSITELTDYLQAATEQTISDLKSLTPAQLEKEVEIFNRTMPGIVLLESGKDHEIHHKGQLFTYARLTGAENLPFFVKL
ncbi:DinB family protein [Jeotgalibacillus sp. S-D1]|uniref:DinB family protein n=1 Tax=Jeotgalibacillus sp. S-D1 TaxID=2552189 RepID=UPI001059813C|nr:DinB family protein [Jeotgalibacillus sp. S-D1]TDL30921.1 DinB family protein [Jeotgalibacillus sp. S-D1]